MNKLAIIFTFIICVGFSSYAQQTFEIAYSTGRNDQARAVVQAFDSGYVVVGSTENYDDNTDVYLMKVDSRGNFLWAERFGSYGNDGGEDLIQLPDSGFLIVGYAINQGNYDVMVIRTDKDGNELFTKFYGGTDWDFGYSVQPTSDNGYLIAGESFENGNNDGFLLKLNASGDSIWTKKFGGAGNDKFEDVVIARNGEYIIGGETTSFGNGRQGYVVRTDTAGTVIWESSYGNPRVNFIKSVTEISTGEIVIAGGTNTLPNADIDNWGAKLSSTGVFIEEHAILDFTPSSTPVENDDWNQFVIEQEDSVIFGGKRSYGGDEAGNIYLYRHSQDIDFSGKLTDFQKFITITEDIAYDAKITLDKGVIIACTGEFLDASPASIYLIKMDSTLAWPRPFSNSITFQNDVTSLSEKEKEFNVLIYPNPTNSLLTIALSDKAREFQVTLRDINGKLMTSRLVNSRQTEIDVTSFSAGIYFVQVTSQNTSITRKVVVTK